MENKIGKCTDCSKETNYSGWDTEFKKHIIICRKCWVKRMHVTVNQVGKSGVNMKKREGFDIEKCPIFNRDMLIIQGRQSGKRFCQESYKQGKIDMGKEIWDYGLLDEINREQYEKEMIEKYSEEFLDALYWARPLHPIVREFAFHFWSILKEKNKNGKQ